jgi:protein gp37
MSAKSKIEWTDSTWNPITGCTAVSAGCQNCYAKVMAERFPAVHADKLRQGVIFSQIQFHPDRLDQPLRWKKPRKVFVCSMGDLFHDDVETKWINEVFRVIQNSRQHTFMILTKRPERMKQWFHALHKVRRWPLCDVAFPNVWIGVTVENNDNRQRIVDMLDTPAAKRFVSVEPMLGDIDLYPPTMRHQERHGSVGIDWVICGAETGPHKRPCKPEWVDSLRKPGIEAGIQFFGKKDSKGEPILPREFPT